MEGVGFGDCWNLEGNDEGNRDCSEGEVVPVVVERGNLKQGGTITADSEPPCSTSQLAEQERLCKTGSALVAAANARQI